MKCQKILKCGDWCCWAVATKGSLTNPQCAWAVREIIYIVVCLVVCKSLQPRLPGWLKPHSFDVYGLKCTRARLLFQPGE